MQLVRVNGSRRNSNLNWTIQTLLMLEDKAKAGTVPNKWSTLAVFTQKAKRTRDSSQTTEANASPSFGDHMTNFDQ